MRLCFAEALLFTCVITEACLTSAPGISFPRTRDLVSVFRDGHIATSDSSRPTAGRVSVSGLNQVHQETLEALIKETDPKVKIPSQSTRAVLFRAQPTLEKGG